MELLTPRLLIREITRNDWRALQRIAVDFVRSEAAAYDRLPPTEDAPLRRWAAELETTRLFFAVLLQSTGEIVGYICFRADGGTYDLGYCFHSGCHGNGYALEGCGALLRHMAEKRGIRRFSAGTALENRPSVRLLERLGFALAGTETVSFHKDQEGNDICFTGGNFLYTPSQFP